MTQTIQKTQIYNLVPYQVSNNNIIEVTQIKDDVWLTRKQMAVLFDCSKQNILVHLQNIFERNIRKIRHKNSIFKTIQWSFQSYRTFLGRTYEQFCKINAVIHW